jgi:hypothetical protein
MSNQRTLMGGGFGPVTTMDNTSCVATVMKAVEDSSHVLYQSSYVVLLEA